MKTEYRYIYFIKVDDKAKTSVWHCLNKKSHILLGIVQWFGPWSQYCFLPEPKTVFNVGCHKDIDDFIDQLSGKHSEMTRESRATLRMNL